MTYPSDFEARLGFDQIRGRIAGYCLGEPGRKKVAAMILEVELALIRPLLLQNLEAKQILDRGDDLPLRYYDDPEIWFQRAAVQGNFLEGPEFHRISLAIQSIDQARDFLQKDPATNPALYQLTRSLSSTRKFQEAVRRVVDDEGNIRDSASPHLTRIRRRLLEEEHKVRKLAEQIMRQAVEQGWTPAGSNPTIRDGRLVIPVAIEHKRKIRGYVIDQSATGQTIFLEPGEVMEANNDLRELELEERKEIIRILLDLTELLRQHLPELVRGYDFLSQLDFNRAKARFSRDIRGVLPSLTDDPALDWKEARHPILFLSLKENRSLVPLTISLLPESRFLLVSGPNAGGKSVCLKTVGLIQYMVQCGLLVPVREDSVMGIFSRLMLDIGDQQSIENDLSTYSSHLKNMDLFIRQSDERSLILIDELGAGTDPNFGGGIAQAILGQLVKNKVWGLASTHYYNLKVFASNFPGIRNAAMLFDTANLSPLFQLQIGQPGSSFALEIAKKTGLSREIITTAEHIIGRELTGLETLMKQVADEKQSLLEKDLELRRRETEVASLVRRYESLTGTLESQKKEILNKAKAEASTLLQETNREIEKTIRHIRENKAEKQETRKVRQGLKDLEKKVKPVVTGPPVSPLTPIAAGDKVRMIGGEVTGTVLSLRGKTAQVQFGELRSTVKVERLVKSAYAEIVPAARPVVQGIELHRRQSSFSSTLDIRGKRVEEVMDLLIRFMDDAVLLGQRQVKILHGKGEGVLRVVVRDYLGKLKSVENFRDEHADRGGDGMTLVTLRE